MGAELKVWLLLEMPKLVLVSVFDILGPFTAEVDPTAVSPSGLPLLSLTLLLYAALVLGDFNSFESSPGVPEEIAFKGDLLQLAGLLLENPSGRTPAFWSATIGLVTGIVHDDGVNKLDVDNIDDEDADDIGVIDDTTGAVCMPVAELVDPPLEFTVDRTTDSGADVDDKLVTVTDCPDEVAASLARGSDLTTSCLVSTLLGPLVRLIFIFRPLSTEAT